jgi:hypothetical protein
VTKRVTFCGGTGQVARGSRTLFPLRKSALQAAALPFRHSDYTRLYCKVFKLSNSGVSVPTNDGGSSSKQFSLPK